jgi:hypothetical protein
MNLVIRGDALGGEAAGKDQAPLGLGSLLGSGGRMRLDLVHGILTIGKCMWNLGSSPAQSCLKGVTGNIGQRTGNGE